ncbi:SIS domain-containing protein [Planosporangium flavigriseum]|uniref:Glucosamine--fructose-6-phosphate aminotransferase n=1 Tax=Planosporangium flavigriseum TaxID=373681 RepID=A0A8J3LGZ9_9ACTN|nr:SIS domain-containing protein [Planosporangium flavigriseum]NJC62968.1 SIS domain-containing protein [Planosporangium flavigriseum]GIG73163.1 glucosamine--fructose-6-phosphate aminotransferase [Planosporangium flavigriseum]
MSTTAEEIATQPDLWRRAAQLAPEVAELLPAEGADVCFVGCGTSLYMAQAAAALRERAGHGRSDAYPASELPAGRRYDVMVAITRSGTTSEVVHVLGRGLAGRSVALTAVPDGPVGAAADDVIALPFADERSVVQTRFATTALTLLRAHAGDGGAAAAAADAGRALAVELPVDPGIVPQWTFVGRGWTVGLAQEAALKLREAAQAWTEAYPALEYRHGPMSVSGPGSVVWSFGPLNPALAAEARSVGATVVDLPLDPLASLVVAQRAAVALAESRGLNPDSPRNLSRSVVLTGPARAVLP